MHSQKDPSNTTIIRCFIITVTDVQNRYVKMILISKQTSDLCGDDALYAF